MLRKLSASLASFALIFTLTATGTPAAPAPTAPQGASDVVMVLPFENVSNQREFNWVGESFADSLAGLLNIPGTSVVSDGEREIVYQRLRLPLTTLPSRATAIKIAREARATMVVVGTYQVAPPQDDKSKATLRGTARVIRVNEGRLMGAAMEDGRWAWRPYDFGGPLTNLQKIQGRLAYDILYERDKALPVSLNRILEQATKVPPLAFESYVKGVLTDDVEKRSAYLQNAMRDYGRANAGEVYAQAAFELGHLYLKQEDWKRAAEHFSMLQKNDPRYIEAAFYAAYSLWRGNDLVGALGALMPLTSDAPLTSIYNNTGAISTQAARAEKKAGERERLLKQAVTYLARAVESSPEDSWARFNYAYALFLSGKNAEAAEQLRPVIKQNPRDGEALFLFAKALERAGQKEAADANDNEARRYLSTYAKLQTEWQSAQTTSGIPVRMHQVFDRTEIPPPPPDDPKSKTEDLLKKARELYAAGRDDEALPELRRVLMIEPMNAEAYLLNGRIYQRRGDLDASISALKTALFWDGKLIDAHILLGRIFLERGDRTMALAHAKSAMQIDPNNQEAVALQRLVEKNTR